MDLPYRAEINESEPFGLSNQILSSVETLIKIYAPFIILLRKKESVERLNESLFEFTANKQSKLYLSSVYFLWFSLKYLLKMFEHQEIREKMFGETDVLQDKIKPDFYNAYFGGLEKQGNGFDQITQLRGATHASLPSPNRLSHNSNPIDG